VRVAQSVLNSFQQSALPVFCCSSRLDKRHSPKTQSQPGRDAKSHRAEGAVSFMETKKTQRALSLVMIRWVVRSCMTNFMTSCESEVTPAVSILIYLRMDYLSSRIVNRVTFCSHRQLGDSGSLVSRLAGYWASRRSCSVFIRSDNSFRSSGWRGFPLHRGRSLGCRVPSAGVGRSRLPSNHRVECCCAVRIPGRAGPRHVGNERVTVG
jgi:hypothetical protein